MAPQAEAPAARDPERSPAHHAFDSEAEGTACSLAPLVLLLFLSSFSSVSQSGVMPLLSAPSLAFSRPSVRVSAIELFCTSASFWGLTRVVFRVPLLSVCGMANLDAPSLSPSFSHHTTLLSLSGARLFKAGGGAPKVLS